MKTPSPHQTPNHYEIFFVNSLNVSQLLYVKIATKANISKHDVRRPRIKAKKPRPSNTLSASRHWQSRAVMASTRYTMRYMTSKLKDMPAHAHQAGACAVGMVGAGGWELGLATGKYISATAGAPCGGGSRVVVSDTVSVPGCMATRPQEMKPLYMPLSEGYVLCKTCVVIKYIFCTPRFCHVCRLTAPGNNGSTTRKGAGIPQPTLASSGSKRAATNENTPDWTRILTEHACSLASFGGYRCTMLLRQTCVDAQHAVGGRLVWQACNHRLCLKALEHNVRRAIHSRQRFILSCLLQHPGIAQVAASDRWQRLVPRPYQTTPLVVDAVATGDVRIVSALADVARDAMLVLTDADGNTCFHTAAGAADPCMLAVLLERIPRNAALQMLNARLETPLHAALAARREVNVALFAEFDAGSVLYAADLFSGNALQRCAWIGNAPCMRRLLERVPPSALFTRCPSGYTTLMVACLRGDLELAELLLEATAGCPGQLQFLAVQSTFGQTCLHVAAMSGNEALVRRLAMVVPTKVVALRNIAGQTAASMCGEMRTELAVAGRCGRSWQWRGDADGAGSGGEMRMELAVAGK